MLSCDLLTVVDEQGFTFLEASALDTTNVEQAFELLLTGGVT